MTILLAYFLFVSIVLFVLMKIDKQRAVDNKWRISERTLLILGVLGGGIGGYLGMFIFHHKSRKTYFHIAFIVGVLVTIASFVIYQSLFS